MLILFALACADDVGEGKVKADVEDVPVAKGKKAKAAAGTDLAVDVSKSKINALGAKITATHPIDFKTFSGTVKVDGDKVTGVTFSADMASLESDHPKLTGHLKNEDFFWVDKYPTADFASVKIKKGWDGAKGKAKGKGKKAKGKAAAMDWTHTVTGDLTLRGKTKRVTFPAAIKVTPKAVKANTEFVIDRKDFDVVYKGKPDDLIQDNVVLTVDFTAPRS